MGRRLEVGQRKLVGPRAKQEVEDPLGPDAWRHRGEQLLGIATVDAGVGVGGPAAGGLQRDEAVDGGDVGVSGSGASAGGE